jgi:hypothetical protein
VVLVIAFNATRASTNLALCRALVQGAGQRYDVDPCAVNSGLKFNPTSAHVAQ